MRLSFKTLSAAATLLASAALPVFPAFASDPVSPWPAGESAVSSVPISTTPLGAVAASSIYAPTSVADSSGVFAGAALSPAHNQGTWRVAMLWYRGADDPDINTQMNGGSTWATTLARLGDQGRAYFASVSGGKLDLVFDIIEVPLDARPDGTTWNSGLAKSTVLPTLGVDLSRYGYVANFYGNDSSSLIQNPNSNGGSAGLGTGAASGTGHSETWYAYTHATVLNHELGHNLNYGHSRSFSNTSKQYVYDYTTKSYVPTSGVGSFSVQNIPIGNGVVEYGHSYSVMAAYPGDQGLTPRQKKANGWLDRQHFANVNALTAASSDGITSFRLYDDMADRDVVTNGLTGDALAYGVKNGYEDVYYNASILRPGETFTVNDGVGKWTATVQAIDLFYRSHVDPYPGLGMPTNAAGVVVDLNNMYMGVLRPGQSFIEKDFSQSLSSVNDTAAYGVAPLNPDRYRSVWYKIDYLDNGEDGFGHFANIRVTALTGADVVGWQWDSDPLTAGAQDGSGIWNATDTRWRSVSLGVDNQDWTAGEDAVIGSGADAAGTITVSGTVVVNSLALKLARTGEYTLAKDGVAGGVISLGAGGLVSEANATISSDIALTSAQIWSVSNGTTLDLAGGALNQAGHTLTKMGQGTLLLSTARQWINTLSVMEGPVTQTATQTFTGTGALSLGEAGEYRIDGGSLILGGGKSVSGSWGLLRLNNGGSAAAPAMLFQGASTISPDIHLSAGTHYVQTGGDVSFSGRVLGDGDLVKTGNGSLFFNNTNSFTGSVTVAAGSLVLSHWDTVSAANDLYLGANKLMLDDEIAGDIAVIGNLSGSAGSLIQATASSDKTARILEVTQTVDGNFAGSVKDGVSGQVVGLTKSGAATLTLSGESTYTGATRVNAGTLRAGSDSAFGVNSAVTVTAGATLDAAGHTLALGSLAGAGSVTLGTGSVTLGGDGRSTAFSGVVSGTGNLTKVGAGVLTLSGQNTYTGVTRVSGGEIRLDYASTTATSGILNGASSLEFSGTGGEVTIIGRDGAAITQHFASTTVSGGINTLRILGAPGGSVDVRLGEIIRTAGTLDFSGSTGDTPGARFLTTTGTAGAMLPGGAWATVNGTDWAAKDATNTYIVAYSDYLDIATGTGTILSSPTANVRLVDGVAGAVSLGGSTVSVSSVLMRASTHEGTIALAGGTLRTGAISVASGSRGLAVGSAANDGVLQGVDGALLLLSNLDSTAGALTVRSAIADADGAPLALTVSGGIASGTVVLSGDNTYSGGTRLTNGATLRVGSGGASGTLGMGAVSLEADTHLVFNRSDSYLLTNRISGAGDFTQAGSGTLVLASNQAYTGTTHIASGTLRVGDGGVAGSLGSGAVLLGSGATLEFNRSDALTVSNTITGAGAFIKSGTNTLTLTNLNSGYTGDVTVASGTLIAAANTGVGTASAFGSGTGTISVESGATLRYDARRAAGYHTGAMNIRGGTVTVNGQDNTFVAGNTVTFDGAAGSINGSGQWRMRDAAGVTVTAAASGSTISVNSLTLTGTQAGAYTVRVADGAAAADLTISGIITGQVGGESLVKTGAGTLKLTGQNTFTGGVVVEQGRLLSVGTGTLGSGAVTLDSGTLAFSNAGLRKSTFSGNGLNTTTPGSLTTAITSDFSALHSTTGGVVPNGATFAYTGRIYMDAGQWSFGEHYDDAVYLKIGDKVVLNNTAWHLPSSGSVTIVTSGWYDIDLRVWNGGDGGNLWANMGVGIKSGGTTTQASAYTRFEDGALGISLAAIGDMYVDNALVLTGAGAIDTSELVGGSSLILSGDISGAGSLEKIGASALVLSGTNTYTGATTVTAGTLRLASGNALGGKGAIHVGAGATLDGAGYSFEASALSGSGRVALADGSVTVRTAGTSAFAGVISGTGALVKSGSGLLSLSGQNTYTGSTTITDGTLRLDFSASTGTGAILASPDLVLAGGRFEVLGHATEARTQAFASTTLSTETGASVVLTSVGAGVTLDLGAFTRTSGGVIDFVLDANPDLNRVMLSGFAAGESLGEWATVNGGESFAVMDATGVYIVAGTGGFTAVDVRAGGSRAHALADDATRDVRIIQGGSTVSAVTLAAENTAVKSLVVTSTDAATVDFGAGRSLRVAGSSGVATVVNSGLAGGLTLGTSADRGVLTAGTGGAAELILKNMNPDTAFTVNAAIADFGGVLSLTTSGPVQLNGTNTYTGATSIGEGTLRLGGAGTLGSGNYAGEIRLAGVLDHASSSNQLLSGVISGTGALLKSGGAGTLILSGENTYSGGTTITSGNIQVLASGALGSGALNLGVDGGLVLDNGVTVTWGTVNTVAGAIMVNSGSTLRLAAAGALDSTGAFTLAGGARLDAAGRSFTLGRLDGAGEITLGGESSSTARIGAGAFSGVISGAGSLVKSGVGELVLSGENTYTGSTSILGGTLTLNGRLGGGAYAGAIANQGVFVIASASDQTLSGVISGTGSLVKSSSGTLTLSGANTYSGVTRIEGGVVKLGSSRAFGAGFAAASGVLVSSGATVDLNGVGNLNYGMTIAGTGTNGQGALVNRGASLGLNLIQVPNLALSADASIGGTGNFAMIASGFGANTLNLDGHTLTKAGTNTFFLANTTATAGAIDIASGTLSQTSRGSNLSAASVHLANASNTGLSLNNLALSVGALSGGGTSGGGVALGNAALTVGALSRDTVFSGVISGTGSVTKLGSGVLTLSGQNTYTGATTLSEGTLRLGDGVTDGGLANASAIVNNAALVFNTLGSRTQANAISGTGSVLKTGTGTLTLSGAGTYIGATTVADGGLVLNGTGVSAITVASGAAFGGSGSTTGVLTFADDAVFSASSGIFSATGGVVLEGGLSVRFDTAELAGTRTLFGYGTSFTGDVAQLSAVNARAAFTHDTVNNAVLVTVSTLANTWNAGSGSWSVGGGDWANGVDGKFFTGDSVRFDARGAATTVTLVGDLVASSVLVDGADDYTFAGAGSLTGAGGLTKSGSGTLTLDTANGFTGGLTIAGGTLALGENGRLGGGSYAAAIDNAGVLSIGTNLNQTLSGVISGSGSVEKRGAGTLTLSGENTYTGGTTIHSGTLAVTKTARLGTGGLDVRSGGTLALTHGDEQVFSSAISGSGSIVKGGSGNLILRGTHSFSGAFTVNSSLLILDSATAENGAPSVVLNSGGLLLSSAFTGGVATLGNLNGTGGNITTTYGQGNGVRTLSVNQTADGVFAGTMTGEATGRRLALVKSGAATLTLSGANTYTGGTTVNAGTLQAGSSGAFGTGAVVVNSGGTLNTGATGTAFTLANAVTVNAGGRLSGVGILSGTAHFASGAVLAPGNSAGAITFASGVSFASGSTYAWELSGANLVSGYTAVAGLDYDLMRVIGGALNIAEGATLKLVGSSLDYANEFWSTDREFSFANISGSATRSGAFTLDAGSAGNHSAYGSWSIATIGDDSLVRWSAIPEPSTYGLIGAGALGVVALVRRRRSAGRTPR